MFSVPMRSTALKWLEKVVHSAGGDMPATRPVSKHLRMLVCIGPCMRKCCEAETLGPEYRHRFLDNLIFSWSFVFLIFFFSLSWYFSLHIRTHGKSVHNQYSHNLSIPIQILVTISYNSFAWMCLATILSVCVCVSLVNVALSLTIVELSALRIQHEWLCVSVWVSTVSSVGCGLVLTKFHWNCNYSSTSSGWDGRSDTPAGEKNGQNSVFVCAYTRWQNTEKWWFNIYVIRIKPKQKLCCIRSFGGVCFLHCSLQIP